jgi:hypothetical protein
MQQYTELPSVKEQTGRTVHSLDAKYEASDLQSISLEKAVHLSLDERQKLLDLLTNYESLFDNTLGGEKMEQSIWSSSLMPSFIMIVHIGLHKCIGEQHSKKS